MKSRTKLQIICEIQSIDVPFGVFVVVENYSLYSFHDDYDDDFDGYDNVDPKI